MDTRRSHCSLCCVRLRRQTGLICSGSAQSEIALLVKMHFFGDAPPRTFPPPLLGRGREGGREGGLQVRLLQVRLPLCHPRRCRVGDALVVPPLILAHLPPLPSTPSPAQTPILCPRLLETLGILCCFLECI